MGGVCQVEGQGEISSGFYTFNMKSCRLYRFENMNVTKVGGNWVLKYANPVVSTAYIEATVNIRDMNKNSLKSNIFNNINTESNMISLAIRFRYAESEFIWGIYNNRTELYSKTGSCSVTGTPVPQQFNIFNYNLVEACNKYNGYDFTARVAQGPTSDTLIYTLRFKENIPEPQLTITEAIQIVPERTIGFNASTGKIPDRGPYVFVSYFELTYTWFTALPMYITYPYSTGGGGARAIPPTFENTSLPQLYINYYLTEDGGDISIVDVNIIDNYQYTKDGDLLYIESEYYDEPITSHFTITHPLIQKMLCAYHPNYNLNDNIQIIFNCVCKENITEDEQITKSENIIGYALVKYVLSAILYGKFDLCYLANSLNCKFYTDLTNSRFSNFIVLFDDPQYGFVGLNNYFIC